MAFDFLDRVAAARQRPRPVFKIFRSRIVMNGDARRTYFPNTDKILLAYEAGTDRLALKPLPAESFEHAGWEAFRLERQEYPPDTYHLDHRVFWDRFVGRLGGIPIRRVASNVETMADGAIAMKLS